jgi:two-component system, NarL family, nitrate/nitrite response regulator NarL
MLADPVIVIVDDHALMGEVLALTLRQRGYDAYFLSATGINCERIVAVHPDLVLLDIAFGPNSRGGIEVLRAIRHSVPHVAMLTGSDDGTILAEAITEGACGIIGKHVGVDDVIGKVEELLRVGSLLTAAEREEAAELFHSVGAKQVARERRLSALTDRERDILQQVSAGASVTDIAHHECVSLATVRTHVRSILQKLDVHSQVAAVAFYLDRSAQVH